MDIDMHTHTHSDGNTYYCTLPELICQFFPYLEVGAVIYDANYMVVH